MGMIRQSRLRRRDAGEAVGGARPSALWSLLLFSIVSVLPACSSDDEGTDSGTAQPKSVAGGPRWYTAENVASGALIFQEHCVACHGNSAQGSFTWRKPDDDGKYPPPPLNGTGHAWHHPIRALGYQIKFGAPGGSGKMPGFAQTLSDQEVIDVIAWFQDKWPDQIYAAWLRRELQSRSSSQ